MKFLILITSLQKLNYFGSEADSSKTSSLTRIGNHIALIFALNETDEKISLRIKKFNIKNSILVLILNNKGSIFDGPYRFDMLRFVAS